MAVGEVLPVVGLFVAERQQSWLLQLVDPFQDLPFGVSTFQRHIEVMQQPAEQTAIQQAKGFPWLGGPQALGGAGNIVGQSLGTQFKVEQLRGCRFDVLGVAWPASADKGAQPLTITPHQHDQCTDHKSPQQHLQPLCDVFEGIAVEVVQQRLQPVRKLTVTVSLVFNRRLVFAKAIARDGFRIFDGRLFQPQVLRDEAHEGCGLRR